MLSRGVTFERFAVADSARLRAGLVAAYGPDVGADAAAEAMAYAFEHWDRLSSMSSPVGYLYRVGQTEARRQLRPAGICPRSQRVDSLSSNRRWRRSWRR